MTGFLFPEFVRDKMYVNVSEMTVDGRKKGIDDGEDA